MPITACRYARVLSNWRMTMIDVILRTLIDAFNTMLKAVSSLPEFGHATFVDLRGTLSQGAGYRNDWANELHPTKSGFRTVAANIAAGI